MSIDDEKPRILFVTPEVSYLPEKMSAMSNSLRARAGELGDVSAALICAIYEKGVDVHVALPDYRTLFNNHNSPLFQKQSSTIRTRHSETKVHLAEDREFFYKKEIYSDSDKENIRVSLAFQREVINTIVPRVQPDLIHCNDWMTGLIPAMARRLGTPCLFTIHNIYNVKILLSSIEDRGIDAALFWQNLFFERHPLNYEETRNSNPVDFLASGIFAAHFVNTTCPEFLEEMIQGEHSFVDPSIQRELLNKVAQGCASGVLNCPDASHLPETDIALFKNYDEKTHASGKKANKIFLQERLGMIKDPLIPLLFWPSCLDRLYNGSYFLSTMLYAILSRYRHQNLEIVFTARGTLGKLIKDIIRDFNLKDRVAVCKPDDSLLRVAYAASDFVLMPFAVEPVSSGKITGLLYGSLPIVHNHGGSHHTITQLDMVHLRGNGFLFNQFNDDSLIKAIDKAMVFYNQSSDIKTRQIFRIMKQSRERFDHSLTASHYLSLYEKMLKRPFVKQ